MTTAPVDDGLQVSVTESRYDRQERVTWWDQSRLAAARVLVAGAGALGNEVVKNLALVGVGDIVVVDGDVVEHSNLARCVFFRAEDEGRPKAEVLASRAAEVNPGVRITGIVGDVRSLGTGIAYRADAMVGALDNREARLYLNRLAARTRRPWIDGAIEGLLGVARVFWPPEVCYECTLTATDWEDLAHRQSCRLLSTEDLSAGKVPTTASTSSVIAAVQAQEVVKLLHRDVEGVRPLRGALLFDGANNDTYPLRYPSADDCLAHHHLDDPTALVPGAGGWAAVTAEDVVVACWGAAPGDGPPAVVELGDDHVRAWHCTACEGRWPEGRPASLLGWADAACPACGEGRMPIPVTSIAVPGPDAGVRLAELGVRPDEILCTRRGLDERSCWVRVGDGRLPGTWREAPAGGAA